MVLQSSSKANTVFFCFVFAISQLYFCASIQCPCTVIGRADAPHTYLFVQSECTVHQRPLLPVAESRFNIGAFASNATSWKTGPFWAWRLRCKPPECQDPIGAPISPCSPTFLLSHFPFSLMTHIRGYATQEAERYTQTNGISILAFQGWSAPNHYDFMIKSLKKSPQTI